MNLEEELKKLKISKAEFSRKMEVDAGLVSKWVSGERPMPEYAITALELLKSGNEFDVKHIKSNTTNDLHLIKRVCKKLNISYKELGEAIGYGDGSLRKSVSENKISHQLYKSIELYIELLSIKTDNPELMNLLTSDDDVVENENIVKKSCRELGITQKELAEKLEVSHPTMGRWATTGEIPKSAIFTLELLSKNIELEKELEEYKNMKKLIGDFGSLLQLNRA